MHIFNERWHVFAQKFSGTLNYKLKWTLALARVFVRFCCFPRVQLKQLPSSWHPQKPRRTLFMAKTRALLSEVAGPWLCLEGSFRKERHTWEEGSPCSVCESRKSLPWSSWCLTCKCSAWEEFFSIESCFLLSLEPPPPRRDALKGLKK